MFKLRTFRVLALLIGAYLLLLLPGVLYPPYFETPAAWLLMAPYLSVSLFHKLGVPGLLEHNGLCGWGWCPPVMWGTGIVGFDSCHYKYASGRDGDGDGGHTMPRRRLTATSPAAHPFFAILPQAGPMSCRASPPCNMLPTS